jgi:membrane associated rhomboid family serine protease
MFFPLHDENPVRRFPLLTVLLIAANAAVFLYEVGLGERAAMFIQAFGAIPSEVLDPRAWGRPVVSGDLPFAAPPEPLTLVTSMFLHGGVMHLVGNMVYLWIFGNNIEDVLGPVRFLVFYLIGGLAAGLAHVFLSPSSVVPAVGASGAISAILGAYLVLYPRARVRALLFLGIFIRLVWVPAVVLLVFWFVLQILSATVASAGQGGVAWFAHIGGFIAGLLLIRPMLLGRRAA